MYTWRTISAWESGVLFGAALLAPLCLAGLAMAAEPVVFEVAAGDFDRQDIAVAAELPAALRQQTAFVLVCLDTGEPTPAQVERGQPMRIWWRVVGVLSAGATRRYRLESAGASSSRTLGVNVGDDGKQLRVTAAGKSVLTYRCAVVPSPDPKEPCYAKSGYIHPLVSPAGKVLTDDFNPDHAHQHGIMFAWRKTTCEGRSTNGWDQKAGQGKVEHVKVENYSGGPVFGQFTVRLQQVDLIAPGGPKPILAELWRVRVEPCAQRYLVDLESDQTCAGQSPVTVDEYAYGGLMIRGAVEWSKRRNFDYVTSEGKTKKDGNHTRPRWVALCGPVGGAACGVLALDHPANFRFPQPVRLHPTMPYFCFTPAVLGSFTIEPGKTYTSRYRFVAYDGKLSPAEAEQLWADYAHPPQVRLVTGRTAGDR